MRQNLNDFGIEYKPILEIFLPGIKKKYEFFPVENLNPNQDNSEMQKGHLQMKKLNNSNIMDTSMKKDFKVFLTKVV